MSYGTRPAIDYLQLYPQHTGEAVIRAAAPVELQLPLLAPRDAQRSFDRLVTTQLRTPAHFELAPNSSQISVFSARVRASLISTPR